MLVFYMQNTSFGLIFMQFKKQREEVSSVLKYKLLRIISQQFKIMLETGHIPENVYDALGFTKYWVSDVVYDYNDGIEREWIQRAKVLTHWFQQHLRLAKQKKTEDKVEKK